MADIAISVSQTSDLFTIALDVWEWTGLYIQQAGQWVPVPKYTGPNPNVQFLWQQTGSPGAVTFKAVANHDIVIVNPGNTLFMAGTGETYMALISYTNQNDEVHVLGSLATVDEPIPNSQPSPLAFSQGRMTGSFSLTTG